MYAPKYTKRLKELCTEHGVPYEKIISPYKRRKLSKKRRELYLLIREEFPHLSTPQIGKLFNRNHATIVQGCQKALLEREQDKLLQG